MLACAVGSHLGSQQQVTSWVIFNVSSEDHFIGNDTSSSLVRGDSPWFLTMGVLKLELVLPEVPVLPIEDLDDSEVLVISVAGSDGLDYFRWSSEEVYKEL
ncbi:hypothetical protein PISMIDRAFT_22791 [Pisolithus microcarpus 441]|uniref:Uncharacterized protein n=1 Tax=Pisolithus microcarpus 441 TaxID=765257 RepID=A0A0C9ZTZ2_9AGAM|nr:hypothetical protein PISMIDRAFT_22791 [Pisolithus microcarpus 441]